MRYDRLIHELTRDQERRLSELRTITETLQRDQTGGEYAGLMMGADINFGPGSLEYAEAHRLGFQDSAHIAPQMPLPRRYNSMSNPCAKLIKDKILDESVLAISGETCQAQQEEIPF